MTRVLIDNVRLPFWSWRESRDILWKRGSNRINGLWRYLLLTCFEGWGKFNAEACLLFYCFSWWQKKNSFQKYFHPLIIHSLDLPSYGSESRMLLCLGRKINDLPEGRVCLGRMGVGGNYRSSSLSLSGFHASYVLDWDALHKEESNYFHYLSAI